ncbi:MAG: ATP-dependent DNA helicase [Bdellovibrionota bacterium]
MKKIFMGVQEFATPSPLTGSIEANSGMGPNSLQKGIELHRQIQDHRRREYPDYIPEVRISHEFQFEDFSFEIEGRMDGMIPGDEPWIEEIKSSFNVHELRKMIQERWDNHPYILQLQTYGYMHWVQTGEEPKLSLHLVSSRNNESYDWEVSFNPAVYEKWLNRRMKELVEDARRAEKRTLRRKKMAETFPFPFEKPRSGQEELIAAISQGLDEKSPMMIQAPTGLGKTVGVLYPALKEAMSRGQKVIYVTPKNSQQLVAEEAIEKFQEKGCQVKSLTLTAKSKLCMKAEPLCNPDYCEYARDYYDKVFKHDLKAQLQKKKKISARVMKNMAEKYQVCPFELQLEAIDEMDTVICDYNYVFAARSALGRLPHVRFEEEGKPNLVVDEAHNLPARAMGYYSPILSGLALEKMRNEIQGLQKKFSREGEEFLDSCLALLMDLAPEGKKKEKIDPDLEPFLEMRESLRGFLSRYLDSDIEIKPRDIVLRLVFYWSEFTDILEQIHGEDHPQFFISWWPEGHTGAIKITCCDASELIKPRYENYENIVAFSATLKPFEYYAKLSGLASEKLLTAEFQSPFDHKRRKILIIPQISTKYSQRETSAKKIAETIERVSSVRKGNYLALFPSFEFMERTVREFQTPTGMRLMVQPRFMKNDDVESALDVLRTVAIPTILFAVQGGHFSEGVDYPGDMLIGAFVVGPPLPSFEYDREQMRDFYERNYKKGFDYAYTYPAMAKAVQSAGRVIRSEKDKGVIILMDDRFLEKSYSQSMPLDWFTDSPRELVSGSIIKDLNEFWSG